MKKCIDEERWDIDLENGIVIGKRGSKGSFDSSGYLQLYISINSCQYQFFVHEIIAVAGGLIPIDVTIDHIDGDKINNKFSNLQLLSNEDNISKAHKGKEGYKGSKHPKSKLTEDDVKEIREILKNKTMRQIDIAKKYNISQETVSDINRGRSWNHI